MKSDNDINLRTESNNKGIKMPKYIFCPLVSKLKPFYEEIKYSIYKDDKLLKNVVCILKTSYKRFEEILNNFKEVIDEDGKIITYYNSTNGFISDENPIFVILLLLDCNIEFNFINIEWRSQVVNKEIKFFVFGEIFYSNKFENEEAVIQEIREILIEINKKERTFNILMNEIKEINEKDRDSKIDKDSNHSEKIVYENNKNIDANDNLNTFNLDLNENRNTNIVNKKLINEYSDSETESFSNEDKLSKKVISNDNIKNKGLYSEEKSSLLANKELKLDENTENSEISIDNEFINDYRNLCRESICNYFTENIQINKSYELNESSFITFDMFSFKHYNNLAFKKINKKDREIIFNTELKKIINEKMNNIIFTIDKNESDSKITISNDKKDYLKSYEEKVKNHMKNTIKNRILDGSINLKTPFRTFFQVYLSYEIEEFKNDYEFDENFYIDIISYYNESKLKCKQLIDKCKNFFK